MRLRLRLWHRLFIALAGLSILALATFAALQQQVLRSGFLAYLNRLSMERAADAAVRLGERYDSAGNWDFLRGRQREFMRILGLPPPPPPPPGRASGGGGNLWSPMGDRAPAGRSAPDRPPPGRLPPDSIQDRRPPGLRPWPPAADGPHRPPPFAPPFPPPRPGLAPPSPRPDTPPLPPPPGTSEAGLASPATQAPLASPPALAPLAAPADGVSTASPDAPPMRGPSARAPLPPMPPPAPVLPPPRPAGPLDLGGRLLLVDAADRYVVGNPQVPADAPAFTVRSHGEVVGRLLLAPLPALRGDLDLSFAQTQLRRALLMAGAVLLGALLASWLLARWLLAPIHALADGTRALVAGRFATRIAETRGDELGALAADFNRLAAALERNQDARRRWGADIAHELRTPVGILRGEIQALQDGVRQVGPDTLASLHGECERLAGLVEDLYQLSLSDAGALAYRMQTLDLREVLQEVVAAHTGALADAGLDLTLDIATAQALPVQGDRQRLAQMFGNLLRNSQRYTSAPGRVRIGARRVEHDVLVDVEDSAPGVPVDAHAHLFDRLFRVESSRSREYGGAGLGLAICRNIVLAHGGQIVASASPLGGLAINLRLPVPEDEP